MDHLIVLKQTIQEMDVQKAHDKAWLDAILHALHMNGVKDKNLKMIKKKLTLTSQPEFKPNMDSREKST